MKTNNNHNHQACEFALESVGYLYGELAAPQKAKFEEHLHKCSVCADDLAAFAGVRSSISDWKNIEFATLSTPIFEIPNEAERRVITENAKISRLDSVRAFFNFSPVWTASAACLGLILLAGLAMLTLFSPSESELTASNNTVKVKPDASPEVLIADPEQKVAEFQPEIQEKYPEEVKKIKQNTAIESVKAKRSVKIKAPVRNITQVGDSTKVPNQMPKKTVVTAPLDNIQQANAPRLNSLPEEETDESLRLADLFAELDTD